MLTGAWPQPMLDGWIRQQARTHADPQRRALVLGGAGALGLAAFGGVLAAATAGIGRALHRPASAATARAAPATAGTPAAAPPSSSPRPSAASAPGRHIATAGTVAPGEAVRF